MNLKSKTEELSKIRAEISELAPKMGQMYHTPKHDYEHYSAAKLDSMEKQMEKLREKEMNMIGEINQFKSSPEFVKDLEAKRSALDKTTRKIKSDLAKTREMLAYKPGESVEAILAGGDPLKMAVEIKALRDHEQAILAALDLCGKASVALVRLGKDIFQPYHAENWPQGQKFDVPTEDQLRAAQ
jgi:DNA repair exonuclease SbcCD ATPase subunit